MFSVNDNIFNRSIGDAVAYFVLYGVIPILATFLSLRAASSNIVSEVYCYVTILITVLNSAYDGSARWRSSDKCRKNTKILSIWIADGILAIYCIYFILSFMIMETIEYRCNLILFTYTIPVLIALWDMGVLFSEHIALRKETEGGL